MPSSRVEQRTPYALVLAVLATLALIVPLAAPAAGQGADAAVLGTFSPLFEEGGAAQDRCALDPDGSLTCKPPAVSIALNPDGSLTYWNGIENTEGNVDITVLTEAGIALENSRSRLLQFPPDGGAPQFTTLTPGAVLDNPAGYDTLESDPLGVLGVPGRPGDGLVGSTLGEVFPSDPVAPPDDPVANDSDMFCSDLTHLPDGRILVAGGSDFYATAGGVPEDVPGFGGMGLGEIEGTRTTQIFDPATGEWEGGDAMKYGRWYPTLTTLPSGDSLVVGGVTRLVFDSQLSQVRRSETFDRETETWSENYTGMSSETSLPQYARMHLTPDGKVFYSANGQMNGFGPTGYAADEATWGLYQSFDPETAEWEIHGPTPYAGLPRNGAFSVPLLLDGDYSQMEILQGGGTLGPTPGSAVATSLSQIITVDSESNVTTRETGLMNNPRWFTTGTLLPDGTVFASGGGNIDHVIASGLESSVNQAEIFDPETETWSPAAGLQRERVYHNSAILLPDGRVLVGGHSPIPLGVIMSHQDLGAPFTNNNKDSSFEVYNPPYLFNADGTEAVRPEIAAAPGQIGYGDDFTVTLQGPTTEVSSVRLIRTGDISHAVDADTRGIDLPFTQNGNALQVEAPPTGIVAPPGHYMLFVNRQNGEHEVPSTAAIVNVDDQATGGDAQIPDYDAAASAANGGGAAPTEDSNIMEGILTRNYPAPGLEEVVMEFVEGMGPGELSMLGELSDEAMANFVETATPAAILDELSGMAGQEGFSEQLYEMWPEEMLGMLFVDGTEQLAQAQSMLLQALAENNVITPEAVPNWTGGLIPMPAGDGLPGADGLPELPLPGLPEGSDPLLGMLGALGALGG